MSSKRTPRRRSQRQKGQELYAARLRAVKPLVSFRLPSAKAEPSNYQKRKVKKYYDYLFGTTDRAGIAQGLRQKVLVRGKNKRAKVQRELGQDELPGLKYVFVTTALDPETGRALPATIEPGDDDEPSTVEVGGIGFLFEPFDREALLEDRYAEIERAANKLLNYAPKNTEIRFKIRCADKYTFRSYLKSEIVDEVSKIMDRYHSTYNGKKGGPWEEWLEGLVMEYARRQQTMVKFDQARELRRDTERKVFKIDQRFVLTLDALDALGSKASLRAISEYATGSAVDMMTLPALEQMETQGFVERTGKNQWRMLPAGRTYYLWGKDLLGFYKRQ